MILMFIYTAAGGGFKCYIYKCGGSVVRIEGDWIGNKWDRGEDENGDKLYV
jgi:hypothetical protein